MADPTYPLHENPEYNEAIRALQDTDPARSSTLFNPLFEAMLNNTHFVKLLAEQLERSKANLVDGKVPLGELPPLNYDPEGTAEAVTGAHDKSPVAHTDIRQAAASAQAAADEARAIAEGRSRGASFLSYEAMVGALNGAAKTAYKMGDNFFIQTVGVPDLWVSSVESTSVPYTWTTEQAFINALYLAGTLQIGFVKVCELETRKVDLSGYVQKTQKVNGKALAADITLDAAAVGARPATWMPTAAQVGARPDTWAPTKSEVGLGSVDNTADLNKPVSTPQQAALNLKAGKSTQVDATIGTAWGGSAGAWTQAISIAGVTATNVVEVFLRKGASVAQDEAYTALQLRDGGQAAGSITLLARGDKNTIAVPITVIVRGDL